ncbi:PAP_central domain-containing protein [Meloidogyne graminicola]|uniref:PAP_central domain-containing protein n=1 Tax=Meloidogyne graminicola TaxID=189291 RepID=A0A8S9Z9N4_9BILA|nr:PAP_central domain-containing protein [Meloidogyne graminicola]
MIQIQKSIDIKIQNDIELLLFNGNINLIFNNKLISPLYYEFSQNLSLSKNYLINQKLINYLNQFYQENENIKENKLNAKNWINREIELWLKKICLNNSKEYSRFKILIGGSTLLEADSANSDLDIIIILPINCLINNKINNCNLCKFNLINKQRFCTEHDLIFGENINSFSLFLKNKINYLNKEESNSFNINIIQNGRIPLINLNYKKQKMDILFAIIPFDKIPETINLTNYETKQIINENLNLLNKLINKMIELNNLQYYSSILLLTGYRFTYRTKFYLINSSRRQIFTNLLKAVKLWAKKRQIYSNLFVHEFNLGDKMPVLTSLFPEQNTAHNVNEFTLKIILREMKEAYNKMNNLNYSNLQLNNINLFERINYKLIYKHFLIIECKSKNYLNENPEIKCTKIKSRIRIAMTKWVNEKINEQILKDCLIEYHLLTGFELINIIKNENFFVMKGITESSQMYQSLILIEMETLAEKFILKLNIYLTNKNKIINSIYVEQKDLDKRIEELINKFNNNLNIFEIKQNYQNNQIINNKIKFNEEINILLEGKKEFEKIFNWSELENNEEFKLKEKNDDYIYFYESKEFKFLEENKLIYQKKNEKLEKEQNEEKNRKLKYNNKNKGIIKLNEFINDNNELIF